MTTSEAHAIALPNCAICPLKIPEERARRGSTTCSEPCRRALRKWRQIHHGYKIEGTPLPDYELLRCLMCPNRIEQTRAQRGGETCSQVCKDAYRQWRLERRREQVCPSCLHPSTPAEWESWRKWRLDNDGVANPTDPRRGNPHWEARARQFRKTLESAAKVADTILEDFRFKLGEGQILEPQSQATMGMLEELLSDVKGKLDDPLPQSTAPKQIRQPRLEEVPCPVCHAPNQFDLDSPPATVIKCATCGQKIADPRVTRSKKFPPLP